MVVKYFTEFTSMHKTKEFIFIEIDYNLQEKSVHTNKKFLVQKI